MQRTSRCPNVQTSAIGSLSALFPRTCLRKAPGSAFGSLTGAFLRPLHVLPGVLVVSPTPPHVTAHAWSGQEALSPPPPPSDQRQGRLVESVWSEVGALSFVSGQRLFEGVRRALCPRCAKVGHFGPIVPDGQGDCSNCPPPCESNALVTATGGAVSAAFGTVSCFARYRSAPRVRATVGFVSVKFWDFSVALAKGGGGTEVCGQQKQSNDPGNNQHIHNTPITGRR